MDIKSKIHTIRGKQVMLDSDLAELYEVEAKVINQAVKRNIQRFPERFCFKLTKAEHDSLRSQFVTLDKEASKRGKHRKYLPYVFTEQGVAMLSSILKSHVAIKVSIQIMDAFVEMRRFLSQNANVFQKFQQIDQKLLEHDKNFEKVFDLIQQKDIKPEKGIFFDGEVFDAHKFVIDLISSAESSIILIDNYIDTTVLTLLSHKKKGVAVTIYTRSVTEKLKLAKEKFNKQYNNLELIEFNKSHDRFLIIDNKQIYHIGASLKDMGKKWFAFSRLEKEGLKMLEDIS